MLKLLGDLVRYRGLIWGLVVRELKARYRGSFLGYFWSFLNPLLQLAVYTIVFTYFMPVGRTDWIPKETYALFLFCGILPWTWFSASVMEATDVLVENGNLIRKLLFPAEVLPIVRVVANMMHFLLGLPILMLAFLVFHLRGQVVHLSVHALMLPVVVLLQLVLTTGFALGLSALSVHFRDLKNIIGNLLMVAFFSSAILYPYEQAIEQAKDHPWAVWLIWMNPFAHLMVAYQHILYFGYPIGLRPFLLTTAFAVGCFVAGYMLFDRMRDSFADEV